ncbi:MAG: pentapeptide repeat-containing protein [Nostoc sp. NMS1]|uniref:pentapeptide repeat-containing protein n=1 Tax=unclassified Nostoc TaxID=2593658 RepID=UPI0025FC0C0B|nr:MULTISPECIES: pentapeptide repeat-containing protein [unclassified Nostoc]MBN3907088.1 pentapeptide repeat-containing protein [Nostoc sp. NMS1]MBN3993000.1 pentapeptide repeat-containing protein [Nostoc sp. NMS2]
MITEIQRKKIKEKKDLRGEDFSKEDIRGLDFTGIILEGAIFKEAKAGIPNWWMILLIICSMLFSYLFGYFLSFIGYPIGVLCDKVHPINCNNGKFALITLSIFLIIAGYQGFKLSLGISVSSFSCLIIFVSFLDKIFPEQENMLIDSVHQTFSYITFISISLVIFSIFACSIVFAISYSLPKYRFVIGFISFIFYFYRAALSASPPAISQAIDTDPIFVNLLVIVFTFFLSLTSAYIGWKAIDKDANEKYKFIQDIVITLSALHGTSFRNSDLTDADFTGATLKSTDFRGATLIRTRFQKAKMLDYIRPGQTYLQRAEVRQLLVTGHGQDNNFDRLDLRGVYFQGANLADASLIGTDLSKANLQDADLSRAKLVQTQLDGTNFTSTTLTGAFIEDWGITTSTKFDGVRCEYVYMRLPTKDNPDPHRKPDNRQEVFADGEFGDFIKPIFDTLDLYHNQGIDPRAIAISFKQLAENHPEADLRIVGMEVRGEDKFLLRAKTAAMADKSELSAEYFDTYNQIKGLPEREIKLLLAEKDNQIRRLENMVMTALERPSFYSNVEQVGFMTNNPGGFSVGGSVDGDINNVQGENNQQRVSNKSSSFNLQGAQFAGGLVNADTVTANQIGGNITNYNPEQKQNLAQAAADIQQLLNQLGQTYPTNTPLEKQIAVTEALKQIDGNPTLKARVIGALKSGGTEALKEIVDHPLVNILLATLEGWQDAE